MSIIELTRFFPGKEWRTSTHAMRRPMAPLTRAAISAAPKVSWYAATAWGLQTVFQKSAPDRPDDIITMRDSGMRTRRPSHRSVAPIVVLNPGMLRRFIGLSGLIDLV